MALQLGSLPERVNPVTRSSVPGRVVLVMQGGGALGSYQAGAYQALHEANIEPDWVIGTSIGAINGAIIAGNEAPDRINKLKEFWERLDPHSPEPLNQVSSLVSGVPNFCYPNPALAWGVDARVGVEQAAMYLVEPLRRLLVETRYAIAWRETRRTLCRPSASVAEIVVRTMRRGS
jgi:NTE family protein